MTQPSGIFPPRLQSYLPKQYVFSLGAWAGKMHPASSRPLFYQRNSNVKPPDRPLKRQSGVPAAARNLRSSRPSRLPSRLRAGRTSRTPKDGPKSKAASSRRTPKKPKANAAELPFCPQPPRRASSTRRSSLGHLMLCSTTSMLARDGLRRPADPQSSRLLPRPDPSLFPSAPRFVTGLPASRQAKVRPFNSLQVTHFLLDKANISVVQFLL